MNETTCYGIAVNLGREDLSQSISQMSWHPAEINMNFFFHIDFLVQFWSQTSDRTLAVLETSPMTAICRIEGLQNSTEGGFLTKNSSGFKGRH